MKCHDILEKLDEMYPVSKAEDWDNSGFLVGDKDQEVKKILVALDADDFVVEEAVRLGADMIVTHHPMIFTSVKSVTSETFTGRRIIKMIKNGIAYYACHTNYDILTMADLNAEMLGFTDTEPLEVTDAAIPEGIGKVGNIDKCSALEFARKVKEVFELEDLRVYGDLNKTVSRAAICSGSGKSMISLALKAGAEVYITGDIDHHSGIDAAASGLIVMDAGHYGTEHCFMDEMAGKLKEMFPDAEVVKAGQPRPYTLI